MTELLHIIDAHTPDEAMLSCAATRHENEPAACLGLSPEGFQGAAEIIRPSALTFGGGPRQLADRLSHGQPMCVWSLSALNAAIGAAKLTASPVILFLPALPAGEMLEKLPWRLAENRVALAVETQHDMDEMLARKMDPKRLLLLPAPVITPTVSDELRRTVREELNIAEDALLLAAPSQMRRGGGHDWACWAHAILRHAGAKMKLLFPRGGPHEPHVRFFAGTTGFEDEIIFADGGYSDDQVLSAADIVLFFHNHDMGQARILQAMAAGSCVLASKIPDANDLLIDGQNGLLSPPQKPRGFSASLFNAAENASHRRQWGAQARKDALSRPTAEAIREQLKHFLEMM